MVNDLLAATDNKTPAVLLSLDITAVFDTLDHRRLIERAKHLFGLDDIVLDWLTSYLTGSTQYVSVGGCRSIVVAMTSEFPQGIGPRAAPVLHLHCLSRNIDQFLWNKLSPVPRRHTTVHRYRPRFSALPRITDVI